jgi:hypothetical protein
MKQLILELNKMKNKPLNTKVNWINRHGEPRQHSLGRVVTFFYAQNWWRENILECQGILSIDERRNSKLKLVSVENVN